MLKIVIIGAAGYVGSELVSRLANKDYELTAITNANGKILLHKTGITVEFSDNYKKLGKFDIVINLAYPKGIIPTEERNKNNQIAQMIRHFVKNDTKIIHVSTQAVFGYELEIPASPERVKNRLDFSYITSKIYMENILIDSFKNYQLHIIRLGNVWGPASPLWTTNLINRISLGDVVGILGKDGYSNITDVENVSSYIEFILNNRVGKNLTFHHLAEFSNIKWSHWINLISQKIDIEPIYLEYELSPRKKLKKEIINSFSGANPITIAKLLTRNQYTGSFLRLILSKFPKNFIENLERKSIKKDFNPVYYEMGINDTFLKIMTSNVQFKSIVDKNWKPVVEPEESWSKIDTWMESAGYFF